MQIQLPSVTDLENKIAKFWWYDLKFFCSLTRAEVLDEMVYLVVNEPSAEGEMQMRFKYANLAAELLTADVPAIIDKLVASTSLLDILYK